MVRFISPEVGSLKLKIEAEAVKKNKELQAQSKA